ncbi:hypothetical protein IPF37_01905 [bacterium]|nr:MAG: hypothetical protein IPF37_01905 [bacterium]
MKTIRDFDLNCLPKTTNKIMDLFVKIQLFIEEADIHGNKKLFKKLNMGTSFSQEDLDDIDLLPQQFEKDVTPKNKESFLYFIKAIKIIKNNFHLLQKNISLADFLSSTEKEWLNDQIAEIIGLAGTILYGAELGRRVAIIKLRSQQQSFPAS